MKRKQAVLDILAAPRIRDGVRLCDAPGCSVAGEFRAPKSRSELTSYYWFCLDHVRNYNKQWNFYAGMNEEEVERQIRFDTTWWRPTWPLGVMGGVKTGLNGSHVRYGAFGPDKWDEERVSSKSRNDPEAWRPRPDSPEAEALAVFDLEPPVTMEDVKIRYKALVKRHHPDANGGSKDAEERLKIINQAYSTLLKSNDLKS